jgi:hypothetical protein
MEQRATPAAAVVAACNVLLRDTMIWHCVRGASKLKPMIVPNVLFYLHEEFLEHWADLNARSCIIFDEFAIFASYFTHIASC